MIHKTAEISLRLQEPLANLLLFMLCSFSVGLTTPTKSHSHKWMFNSSVITWCCIDTCDVCKSKVHAKCCRITVLTTAKHSTLWSSASNSSYSGICIGHLLLRFLDCISDLWTAWRSGAVRRSHVWSRKMSRTRPGNKVSICTCLSEANDESPGWVSEIPCMNVGCKMGRKQSQMRALLQESWHQVFHRHFYNDNMRL